MVGLESCENNLLMEQWLNKDEFMAEELRLLTDLIHTLFFTFTHTVKRTEGKYEADQNSSTLSFHNHDVLVWF